MRSYCLASETMGIAGNRRPRSDLLGSRSWASQPMFVQYLRRNRKSNRIRCKKDKIFLIPRAVRLPRVREGVSAPCPAMSPGPLRAVRVRASVRTVESAVRTC